MIVAASGNTRNVAIVQLLLQTGMRVGDLCELEQGDVGFRAHQVRMKGKGNKMRELPVPPVALEPLKAYLEQRGFDDNDALFVGRFGERLSPRSVQKLIVALRLRAGLDKQITPHTFRHTYISHHARSGLGDSALGAIAGHEHPSTTAGYKHDVVTEQMMRLVERNALV